MILLMFSMLALSSVDKDESTIAATTDTDKITVGASSTTKVASFEQKVSGPRSSGSQTPDPCSDPNSPEFSQGYSGSQLMCRCDGTVGELVVIEHERHHLAT